MNCIVCRSEYSHEKPPMTFPCTHTICSTCVEIVARDNASVFKCPICRALYSTSLGRISSELLDLKYKDLNSQCMEINNQIKCLQVSKRNIRDKLDALKRAKSASLPDGRSVLEKELDDAFDKILEECKIQYVGFKKEYLKIRLSNTYPLGPNSLFLFFII